MKRKKNIEFIDESQERSELKRIGSLKGLLGGSLLTRGKVVRQLPYILFLTILAFIYIGNRYHAEKLVRKNSGLQEEVEELRAKAITTSAELMSLSQQSQVIRLIRKKDLGLEQSVTPPKKIVIQSEED
ncbi:MAG: FtsL-like putative cell division protein [Bacteroidota bacterium]